MDGDHLVGIYGGGKRALWQDGRVLVEREARHFAPLDLRGEIAQRRGIELETQCLGGVGDHAAFAVKEAGHLPPDHLRPEVAELRQGSGMKGARRNARCAQLPQATAQFRRRPRGEGESHHAIRSIDAGDHPIGDAVRDRPGLAGAGAGEHAERSEQGLRGDALLVVEGFEQGVCGGHHCRLSAIGPPYQCSIMARAIEV